MINRAALRRHLTLLGVSCLMLSACGGTDNTAVDATATVSAGRIVRPHSPGIAFAGPARSAPTAVAPAAVVPVTAIPLPMASAMMTTAAVIPAATPALAAPTPALAAARPALAAAATPASQSVDIQLVIPSTVAAVNAASYVSPATRSIRVILNGARPVIASVGSGVSGCNAGANGITCNVLATIPAAATVSATAAGFASTDASGVPLELAASAATLTQGATVVVTPVWAPVVASLATTIGGKFAAGVPSTVNVLVTANDAAGSAIPADSSALLDATGAPLTLTLGDSDTSGMTQLSASTYSAAPLTLAYDGDLPLPNPITITTTANGAKASLTPSAASVVQPTASKNFTFSFGAPLAVPNSTGIPITSPNGHDWWNEMPDSKLAIVNQGTAGYLISWGSSAWMVRGASPYLESVAGTSARMYQPNPPQNFEQAGWWFDNIFPLNNPYHPTDTQNLVSFYHAESNWTGPHTKTVAVSYSHDGGKTWSPGAQILTPNGYTAGTGISSGDHGAIYDPVNKRWVIFFTAIDPSSNISGSLSEAISNSPTGAPGTWYKLMNGAFSQPGLQGQETSLPSVQNGAYTSSASISWNSYLNEWVLLADCGGCGEVLMTSTDLYTWSKPIKLMDGSNLGYVGGSSAYLTLVGDHDDKITGQTSHLYFAEFSKQDPRIYGRIMLEQSLTFHRND